MNTPFSDLDLKRSDISLDEYSGIGKAQNITEYGEGYFLNNDIYISNNENATIIVPNEWNASEITCNISNIYEYDTEWINGSFDTGIDSSLWSNHTNFRENVTFGWYGPVSDSNDSIYIRQDEAYLDAWDYVDSYWNLTLSVPRDYNPNQDWLLSFNYRYIYTDSKWLTTAAGTKNYYSIQNSGQTTGQTVYKKMSDIGNNTWEAFSVLINPSANNFQLPGEINLLLGLRYGQTSGYNPTGYLEMYFDNISLEMSTFPKPSQINLSINDITNNVEREVNDAVGSALGTINLQNYWEGGLGGKYHYFNFSSNSSGNIFVDSEIFVKAQSSEKTKTEVDYVGSEFIVENNMKAIWTQYYTVSVPGSYSNNYYFNVSKPANWKITELINPYGGNRINDVIATSGPGNTTLVVPNHIILNGRWKIVSEAPNYVDEAHLYKDVASIWQESISFQVPETIKVNASISTIDNPNIDSTNASLLIYLPNGTLWYQQNKTVSLSGAVEFDPIVLDGSNTTIGEYTIHVIWCDNDLNQFQLGLGIIKFEIFKDSKLERSNFHSSSKIQAFSGDHLLLKVNFTDLATGEALADATVNYTLDNATAMTGYMIYEGGGIYIIDIDTSGLLLRLYNVSVSAVKPFYSEQHNIKLFEIEIQLYTSLERISYPTFVQWNENITLRYSYKDSYDVGITGATISLDIAQHYIKNIDDLGAGNYSIEFESAAFEGIGTHQISVNFTTLNYETQFDTIQFEIIAQDVNIEVELNSNPLVGTDLIDLYFRENITITARANATIDNTYLKGGRFTLLSDRYEENLTEIVDSFYSLNLTLSGNDFNSGLNTIFIRFQKMNYTESIFSFQLFLRTQDLNISVYIDSDYLELDSYLFKEYNDVINLSCKAYAAVEEKYITGGNHGGEPIGQRHRERH